MTAPDKQELVFSQHAVCLGCAVQIEVVTPTRANVLHHGIRFSPRTCACGAVLLLVIDCETLNLHGWN